MAYIGRDNTVMVTKISGVIKSVFSVTFSNLINYFVHRYNAATNTVAVNKMLCVALINSWAQHKRACHTYSFLVYTVLLVTQISGEHEAKLHEHCCSLVAGL